MTPREHVELLAAEGEEILLADGFEGALMGIVHSFEATGIHYRARYSMRRCVEILHEERFCRDGGPVVVTWTSDESVICPKHGRMNGWCHKCDLEEDSEWASEEEE